MAWFCFFIFWNLKSKAIVGHFLQRRKPSRPIVLFITEPENGQGWKRAWKLSSSNIKMWCNYVTKLKRKLRPPFNSLIPGKVLNDNWFPGKDLRRLSVVPVNREGSSFSHTNSSQLNLRRKLCNNITNVS